MLIDFNTKPQLVENCLLLINRDETKLNEVPDIGNLREVVANAIRNQTSNNG